jgi:hypothetical protein
MKAVILGVETVGKVQNAKILEKSDILTIHK